MIESIHDYVRFTMKDMKNLATYNDNDSTGGALFYRKILSSANCSGRAFVSFEEALAEPEVKMIFIDTNKSQKFMLTSSSSSSSNDEKKPLHPCSHIVHLHDTLMHHKSASSPA